MKTPTILTVFLVAMPLVAYSSEDKPSASDARKVIELAAEKTGCLKVKNFEKTNATEGAISGVRFYEVEYKASYEVIGTCYGKYDSKSSTFDEPPSNKPNKIREFSKEPQSLLAVGDKYETKGRLAFVKKKNGWEGKKSGFHF